MMKTLKGFIGSYSLGYSGRGDGIYSFTLDTAERKLSIALAAEAMNPSWLLFSPSRKTLYAVVETGVFHGFNSGGVAAYSVGRGGRLSFVNHRPSLGGDPCHLALDKDARFIAAANYSGGSLALLPVNEDGSLNPVARLIPFEGSGPDKARQEGPHIHSTLFDPRGARAFVCDLGTDTIHVYRVTANLKKPLEEEKIQAVKCVPGSGPRHGVFSEDGKGAFFVCEMGSTLTIYAYDEGTGALTESQSLSTLPEGVNASGCGNTAAAVKLCPGGKRLYVSNRGHDSIALFERGVDGFHLAACFPSGGERPRDFAIDPSGSFLLAANQASDKISVFSIGKENGALSPLCECAVPSPVCVIFNGAA
jgi:6-phosphogluconolactonase